MGSGFENFKATPASTCANRDKEPQLELGRSFSVDANDIDEEVQRIEGISRP
jgi:hypothetical protein